MNVNEERERLISQALELGDPRKFKAVLFPWDANINNLKKYSRINLKKHRNLKKFLKSPSRYVNGSMFRQWLASIMCAPIRRALEYNSLGRMLLVVDPLPEGMNRCH